MYAFCRFVDDVADDEGRRDPAALLARVARGTGAGVHRHADASHRGGAGGLGPRFGLPQSVFVELIDGVEMDLTRRRYATFEELLRVLLPRRVHRRPAVHRDLRLPAAERA